MKILFLTPYPTGEAPSQRFRFEQYFSVLSERKIEFEQHSFLDLNTWREVYKTHSHLKRLWFLIKGFFMRISHLRNMNKYDFVFIHREASPVGPPIFEWIVARMFNKKIIYDFDDAIWLSDKKENWVEAFIKFRSKVSQVCSLSYRVSCGNNYLASYALRFTQNVKVNPTTIDTNYHVPKKVRNKKIIIGWTGTHSTLKYLDTCLPALKEMERTFSNVELLIICDQAPSFNLKNMRFVPWSKESEIEWLNTIDIGIMPLPLDNWTLGKCGFKALQFMSLEIPVVASPVGVNKEIINDTINGFLSSTTEEWIFALSLLIKNPDDRDRVGKRGRKTVEDYYSVDANSDNFLSLFE